MAIRWLALLHGRVDVSLAATGGVHTSEDAVKAILAGADAVMMTSALLRDGIGRMRAVRNGPPTGSTRAGSRSPRPAAA